MAVPWAYSTVLLFHKNLCVYMHVCVCGHTCSHMYKHVHGVVMIKWISYCEL